MVLTDDTEQYVSWLEGPWPFEARLVGPGGVEARKLHAVSGVVFECAERWYRAAAEGKLDEQLPMPPDPTDWPL